jgi:hypothetical protein
VGRFDAAGKELKAGLGGEASSILRHIANNQLAGISFGAMLNCFSRLWRSRVKFQIGEIYRYFNFPPE